MLAIDRARRLALIFSRADPAHATLAGANSARAGQRHGSAAPVSAFSPNGQDRAGGPEGASGGLDTPEGASDSPAAAEADDEPKELEAPPEGNRLHFFDLGMAIKCLPPSRPGLPPTYWLVDAGGTELKHGSFDSLIQHLEQRHGGPLPKPDLRSEESYRGGEPSRPDKRELPPPAPGVVRSYERCSAGRL